MGPSSSLIPKLKLTTSPRGHPISEMLCPPSGFPLSWCPSRTATAFVTLWSTPQWKLLSEYFTT